MKKQDTSAKAMNLFGGPTTLLINLCALFMAGVVTAERIFVEQHLLLYFNPSFYWSIPITVAVPVAVMFVIGGKRFSYFFLVLYLLVSLSIAREIWQIQTDTVSRASGMLIFPEQLFFLIALVCLAAAGIRYIANNWNE